MGLSQEAENFLEHKILEILAKAKQRDSVSPLGNKDEDDEAIVLPQSYKQRSRMRAQASMKSNTSKQRPATFDNFTGLTQMSNSKEHYNTQTQQ